MSNIEEIETTDELFNDEEIVNGLTDFFQSHEDLSQNDALIELVAHHLESLKQIRDLTPEEEDDMINFFETHVGDISSKFQHILDSETNVFYRMIEFMTVKYNFFDLLHKVCFDKILTTDKDLSIDNMHIEELKDSLKSINSNVRETFLFFKPLVIRIYTLFNHRLQTLKEKNEVIQRETNELLKAAEVLQEEHTNDLSEFGMKLKEKDLEILNLKDKIKMLEQQLLAEKSKNYKHDFTTQVLDANGYLANSGTIKTRDGSDFSLTNTLVNDSFTSRLENALISSPLHFNPNSSSSAPVSPQKTLKKYTLRKTEEMIQTIYAEKAYFDELMDTKKKSHETAREFIMSYFIKNFGDKSIVKTKLKTFSNSLKEYASESNFIKVFLNILENNIDENFVILQSKLEEIVDQILKAIIRTESPNLSELKVSETLEHIKTSTLQEKQWLDVIRTLYDDDTFLILIRKVREQILRETPQGKELTPAERLRFETLRDNNVVIDEEILISLQPDAVKQRISFKSFIEILLDFNLQNHLKFLEKFVEIFREIDVQNTGKIDDKGFLDLLRLLTPSRLEVECADLLNIINPHKVDYITFSQCVAFLAVDIQELNEEIDE
eukprot:TRINITY_DN3046_c1_g3_i1.p1 TRINITY_DN3046_c1_g3~~TRINITY_DN3046_c1_g3_i1.p1  ORF type:complete len:619 (-),score=173.80 TRINITY_DN3046_c1_g3_i1:50-1876(-)